MPRSACVSDDEMKFLKGEGVRRLRASAVLREACCVVRTALEMLSAGEIWAGRPAKLLRKLDPEEAAFVTRCDGSWRQCPLWRHAGGCLLSLWLLPTTPPPPHPPPPSPPGINDLRQQPLQGRHVRGS